MARFCQSCERGRADPYQIPPPDYVSEVIGREAVGWHSPEWWATHWRLTDLVDNVTSRHGTARMQEHGCGDGLHWSRALGEVENSPVVRMLKADDKPDRILYCQRDEETRPRGVVR